MNEGRAINVTRCGDQAGCVFKDRIGIEFSPSDLSSLEIHFREQAMKAEDYDAQTGMRIMHDTFEPAYGLWGGYRGDKKNE